MYDVVVPNKGKFSHNGIAVDVVVKVDSMEDASNIARGAANHIFSLITLCPNTRSSRCWGTPSVVGLVFDSVLNELKTIRDDVPVVRSPAHLSRCLDIMD